MARLIESMDQVRGVLESARVIAVLGAHPAQEKPAHYVPAYLLRAGYRVVPVNPRYAGTELFGETVRSTLAEVGEVDVVDVFRRSEDVPDHLPEILAMDPRPKVVWLQSGIRNDPVADLLLAQGIDVVQDRCMLADHRVLGLARR